MDAEIANLQGQLTEVKRDEQAWITASAVLIQERDIARAQLTARREGRDYGG